MRAKKPLQVASFSLSALVLLYLLFVNVWRGTFIINDWFVVIVDLFVKVIVELYVLMER